MRLKQPSKIKATMWYKSVAMKKRHANTRSSNRSMVAAITLCAALAVSGCGIGAGSSHGNHAVVSAVGEPHGEHGEHGEHVHGGHADNLQSPGTGATSSGANHAGHEHKHKDEEYADPSLEWTFDPKQPGVGEAFEIRIDMKDGDGHPIDKFDLSHEKLMHLIVVSEDLSQFHHLHPDYDGNSGFRQEAVLQKGGEYRLFADYKPAGESPATAMGSVHVAGAGMATPIEPDADIAKAKQVNGLNVSLEISTLTAGQEARMTFTFEDGATGAGVTDLEPYLGAIGHVVIVGEGAEEYLHVHAENDNGSGPEAMFATTFPKAGLYRIWGQFQRNGEPFTISYTVKVE